VSNEKGMSITFFIFILFGVLFLFIGVRQYRAGVNFRRVAVETTAVITDIVVRDDSRSAIVMFEVDGEEFGGRLSTWHAGMAIGQDITVFYHPNNPQNFLASADHSGSLMFAFIGGIFSLIGVGYFYKQYRRNSLANSLIASGKRIMATFIEMRTGNTTINHQTCCNLICEYRDEMTGNVYVFKSEDIWELPPFDREHQQIPLVPVYVDHYDYSKHYVAVDEFFDAIEAQSYIADYSQRVG